MSEVTRLRGGKDVCTGLLRRNNPPPAGAGWGVGALGVAAVLAGLLSAPAIAQERSIPPAELDDPVLLSALAQMAIERSLDLDNARFQLGVAQGQVSEAWSEAWPSLSLNSNYTRNIVPQVSFLPARIFDPTASDGDFIPIQFGADNLWNLGVNVEQKIVDPGVFVGLRAVSRVRVLQEEALRGRTQQVVTRVRIAVYDLLLAQEEVRLTRNSLRRVRQALDETRAMAESGMAELYDVLRLEVELANLEPTLRRAENRHSAARRAIATELALDPETPIDVAGELAEMDLERPEANSPANLDILGFRGIEEGHVGDLAEIVRGIAQERPDVRQAVVTEELRGIEVRLEQVENLPRVTAFGSYGLAAQQNGGPDFFGTSRQRGSSRQVGVNVTIPLFSAVGRQARIRQRRMTHEQARTQARLARDQAEIQVRNFMDQIQEARQRVDAQRLAVTQAGRGYEIASAQYREGLAGRLELTDAEVALRQSEFNYAQAVYDYLAAGARLDEAAGRVPLVGRRQDG